MDLIFNFGGQGPALGFGMVLMLALIIVFVANRWRVAGANEALIIAGASGGKIRDGQGQMSSVDDKGLKVVVGTGTLVLPLKHKVGKMDLSAKQVKISLEDAITKQGIRVAVNGVATFKVGRDAGSIRAAAERFMHTKEGELSEIVRNVLEGSLRAIIGTLTVEELITEREKLLQSVQSTAASDLATSGIVIDNLTIQQVESPQYIDLIGARQIAEADRLARMAKAEADQQATIREAEARQAKINADREVAITDAEAKVRIEEAKARAAQAGPLADAKAQQDVITERTRVAEREAQRKEAELQATVVKPAEAEKQATILRAEAARQATIAEAEATAQRTKLEGQAAGEAIKARGLAEAESISAQADAYSRFEEAATLQLIVKMLPELAERIAKPMDRIDSITIIGGGDDGTGASDVVRQGARSMTEVMQILGALTGIEIKDLIQRAAVKTGATVRTPRPSETPAAETTGEPAASTPASTPAPAASAPAQSTATVVAEPAVEAEEEGAAYEAQPVAEPEFGEADLRSIAASLTKLPFITRYRASRIEEVIQILPGDCKTLAQRLPAGVRDLTVGDFINRYGPKRR